ncbi:MAG: hypothetical protein ACR2L6_06870 [Gemmatimonadaceae bacterium]
MSAFALVQPLQAQGAISAGQTVSGRLDTSDYLRDDGTYYDDWFYEGRAGEQISVTQRSSDFDSWLLIGRVVNGVFQLEEFDDDGAGGNDSRINYTLSASGRYVIRVNVVGRGRTGSYTLRVDRTGGGSASAATGARTLLAGQSFTSELDPSDPLWTDDTHYELWRYNGRAGERLTVIMRSPSFNSYMQYGRMNGGELSYLGGSTSRTIGGQHETVLEVTLAETGEYGIRANSHGRYTGQYVITVSSSGGAASTPSAASGTITFGSTIRGTLTPSDAQTDSGWYHDDYTFSGSRGQVVYLDLMSDDFDAFIDLYQGTTWVGQDDDGGDGLNSRLAFTLPESGTYTICARSRYANRTGSYALSLR